MKQKALIHGIAMSASIFILTACDNSGKEETIAGHPYQYDCGDAGAVIFQVDGNDTAILQIGANAMVLTRYQCLGCEIYGEQCCVLEQR